MLQAHVLTAQINLSSFRETILMKHQLLQPCNPSRFLRSTVTFKSSRIIYVMRPRVAQWSRDMSSDTINDPCKFDPVGEVEQGTRPYSDVYSIITLLVLLLPPDWYA